MAKKDKKKEKPKEESFKTKVVRLLQAILNNLIHVAIFVFIGVFSVTQFRFSQTKLIPDCLTAYPYSNDKVPPEQVHLDYLSNKSKSGDMRSIKAYYPVNYNDKIVSASYLYKVMRILTKSPHSNVLGNYLGTIFSGMTQNYSTVYMSIMSLFNSILPELVIFVFGLVIILIAHIVAILYSTIKGVIAFFTEAGLIYYEKEIIVVNDEKQANWKEGQAGMWEGWNILYSLLFYFILICGLVAIIPTCTTLSLFMFVSIVFTPFFLLRLYTSTKEIDTVIQKNADKMTFGVDSGSSDDKNMKGGADDSDDKENGSKPDDNEDDDKDDKEDDKKNDGNASDEEDDTVNGQPHPNMPKRFTLFSHMKKFIKIYRNFILFIISLFLIMDMARIMGVYAMWTTVFTIIVLWYFTELYKPYKIKDVDKFTTYLLGTDQAEKECKPEKFEQKPKEAEKKWYFLWLM